MFLNAISVRSPYYRTLLNTRIKTLHSHYIMSESCHSMPEPTVGDGPIAAEESLMTDAAEVVGLSVDADADLTRAPGVGDDDEAVIVRKLGLHSDCCYLDLF